MGERKADTKMSKVWTEEQIVDLLNKNVRAVEKAIVALYERQTHDEQVTHGTRHHNRIGFSAADAKRLSFIADFLNKGGHLKTETCQKYLPRVLKYRKQLAAIANENEAKKGGNV